MKAEAAADDQADLGVDLLDDGVAEVVDERRFDLLALLGDAPGEPSERFKARPSGPFQPGVEQCARLLGGDAVDLPELLGEQVGAVEALVELLDAGERCLLALGQLLGVLPEYEACALEFLGELGLAGAARLGLLELIFAFFFVDLFDNVGTLVGVCEQGGFMRDGQLPRAGRALLADAVGTIFGSLTGTSTVTSYIESAAGVAAGARTGLGNLVIAALFLAALFCSPLVSAIPGYATAPALILVGALMCQSVARVRWDDFSEAFPAFLTLAATPLTFSVATGLSLGLISYTLIKLGSGKHKEISPLIWILTLLFLLRYAYFAVE